MDTHLFCPDKHLAAKTGQTRPLATAPAGVLSAAHVRVLVVAVSTNAVGTSTWLWKLLTVSCAPRSSSALPPAAINIELVTVTAWSSVVIRSTSFEADPPVVFRRDPMKSMVLAVPSAMITAVSPRNVVEVTSMDHPVSEGFGRARSTQRNQGLSQGSWGLSLTGLGASADAWRWVRKSCRPPALRLSRRRGRSRSAGRAGVRSRHRRRGLAFPAVPR